MSEVASWWQGLDDGVAHPQSLPLGTRLRLVSGRTGVLIACTFTWAKIKLDTRSADPNEGAVIEVSPAAEVEVIPEGQGVVPDAPKTPHLRASGAPENAPSSSGEANPLPTPDGALCGQCGRAFVRQRKWARFCGWRCRKAADVARRRAQRKGAT